MGTDDRNKPGAFEKILDNTEIIICLIPMILMTVIIFIHVIFRYVLKSPLTWSEEVARMCLIWITFGGSAYTFKVGAHVGVTYFIDKLPERLHFGVQMLSNLVIILFFVMVLVFGIEICGAQLGRFSKAAHVPLVIPYLALPLGSVLVIIRIFLQSVKMLKARKAGEMV